MLRILPNRALSNQRLGLNVAKKATFSLSQTYKQCYYSSKASQGNVKEITDLPQFRDFVGNSDKVSVIDFYATWCGPCKALEPIFAMLSERVPEVQFGRVDVDNTQDVALEYGITAMPTCLFFKNGEKLDTIVGANPPKLIGLIQEHSGIDLSNR